MKCLLQNKNLVFLKTNILLYVAWLLPFISVAQLPEGFSDEAIAGPWDIPIGITFDETGNGYIWASTGKVYFMDTTEQITPEPILDISEEVGRWLDHGMLGFALDPAFLENGKVYMLYTVDRHHLYYFGTNEYDPNATETHQATIGRLTSYAFDLSQDIPVLQNESRKVLIGENPEDGFPIYYASHGVGGLAFGTDGTLLVSCGESGSSISIDNGSDHKTDYAQALEENIISPKENVGAFKSQLIDNLNGKLLRIDPETGAGLPSNPFYDEDAPFADRSRIWSIGLRNPWRIYVIPESGSHYPADGQPGHIIIGDVGDGTWEEISLVSSGGQNLGWPLYEGFEPHPELFPLTTYNQDAPNPLSNQDECPEYFSFQHLLRPFGNSTTVGNPCDETQNIPADIPIFSHHPPLIAYRNQTDTSTPFAQTMDEDGNIIPIDEAGIGDHFQGDASMAGLIYQGDQFPEDYQRKYFHADYRGWIRVMDYLPEGQLQNIDTFHMASEKIVSLAEQPKNGYLYYINLEDKNLHRIKYGGPPIPVVKLNADPLWGPGPLEVRFDASESGSTGSSLSYHWDFGDGHTDTSIVSIHTFNPASSSPTVYEVTLSIRDTFDQVRSKQISVSVNNSPPDVSIISPENASQYPTDATSLIRLDAISNDIESNTEDLEYDWQVYLHHNDHFHPSSASEEQSTYALISPLGCHTDEYWYRIILRVTDPHQASNQDEVIIIPDCEEAFIEFTNFEAHIEGKKVILNWQISSNAPVNRYEIQRSDDFLHFERLQILTNTNFEGTATDDQPLNGPNIYRIKAISQDGRFRYSPLLSISYPPDFSYSIYPNPTTSNLQLELVEAQNKQIRIQIFDVIGQLVQNYLIDANIGETLNHEILTHSLASGLYFLEITNGEKRVVDSFVKR